MFGFRKHKTIEDSIHVILLAGDTAGRTLSDAQMERTTISIDENGQGGMVITFDDPAALRAQYVALGFRTVLVGLPKKRPNETPHMVAMDLKLTGEYQQMRRKLL
jgi:hypothetical protein